MRNRTVCGPNQVREGEEERAFRNSFHITLIKQWSLNLISEVQVLPRGAGGAL